MNHVLQTFSPPVCDWFRAALGEPTPPQVEGWPAIQRGEHTLILAPTGSGETLAAFLWGIDALVPAHVWPIDLVPRLVYNVEWRFRP